MKAIKVSTIKRINERVVRLESTLCTKFSPKHQSNKTCTQNPNMYAKYQIFDSIVSIFLPHFFCLKFTSLGIYMEYKSEYKPVVSYSAKIKLHSSST